MNHITKFRNPAGQCIGHVVQPEDRRRIHCKCGKTGMFCDHPASGEPPYMYRCLECSPLPEQFARGKATILIQKAGTDRLFLVQVETRDSSRYIVFRATTTGKRVYQYWIPSDTEAINYAWGVAQVEGVR